MNPSLSLPCVALFVILAIFFLGGVLAYCFPSLRKVLRILAFIYLTLFIPLLFYSAYQISFFPPFTHSPRIVGHGESRYGKFMVVATSDGFPDWWTYLYWKRPSQPWAVYFLFEDSGYWNQVQMTETGDVLHIKLPWDGEDSVADLNLKTYLLKCSQGELAPINLVISSDPFSRKDSLDRGDRGWDSSLWPVYQKATIPDK